MKGLILKDFLAAKKQGRVLLLLIVFYAVYAALSKSTDVFWGISGFLCIILLSSSMSYDEYYKWDKRALSMPIKRSEVVISKFIFGIIVSLVSVLLTIGIVAVFGQEDLQDIILSAVGILSVAVVFISVIIPATYKFGMEKGRVIMMALFVIPMIGLLIFSRSNIAAPELEEIGRYISFFPIAAVVILVVSVLLSIRIYNNKEF